MYLFDTGSEPAFLPRWRQLLSFERRHHLLFDLLYTILYMCGTTTFHTWELGMDGIGWEGIDAMIRVGVMLRYGGWDGMIWVESQSVLLEYGVWSHDNDS